MNETDPLHSSLVVNCVFNAFAAYTAIMLNILTIHAMRKTSSLPKPLKTLLLSLAVSDLGVGLLTQPLHITWMVNRANSTITLLHYTAFVFIYTSFCNVVAISVDRFLAVHLHLRYQELVTHKRVVAVVISIWVFSAFLTSIWLWASYNIAALVDVIIESFCYIITATVYCRMYFTVQRHAKQIQVQQIQVGHNSQMESAARQRKSAVNAVYVYLMFLLCLPDYSALVASLISAQSTALHGVFLYTLTLVFLKSQCQ